MVEPTISAVGERYKPNLVVMNEGGAIVLDVTVRYEKQDFLVIAVEEKVQKYTPILNTIKDTFKIKKGKSDTHCSRFQRGTT